MAKRIPVLGTVALAFFFIVALMLANSQAMAGEATTVTETTPPPPAQTVTETTPAPSSGSGSGSGSNSGSKSGSTSTKAPRRKVVVVTHTVRVPAETNDTAVAQGGIQAGGGGMAATGLSGLQLLALGSGALALILALSAGGLTVRRRSVEL
jgi:uncharacterized membrane protein YgcG